MGTFGSLTRVTVGKGMFELDDGKTRVNHDLKDIRELAVSIPEEAGECGHRWIVVLEGQEYVLPNDAEGLEDLLREFRDDQVFYTHPVDRPDIRPGRWTIWEKDGAG